MIIWVIFIFVDYFLILYFIQPVSWLLVCITLLILSIRQIIKIIRQRKHLHLNRILNFSITLILFCLTFYNFNKIPKTVIEKIDWFIFYNKRKQIVKEVELGNLEPNTKMNNGICKLPFRFPMISNGGNDIWIFKNENIKTIKFWITRGFFESPQKYFIYTNDTEIKKIYQDLIKTKPEYNWQIEENWYRITERD